MRRMEQVAKYSKTVPRSARAGIFSITMVLIAGRGLFGAMMHVKMLRGTDRVASGQSHGDIYSRRDLKND